jgi:hypothetical protein
MALLTHRSACCRNLGLALFASPFFLPYAGAKGKNAVHPDLELI